MNRRTLFGRLAAVAAAMTLAPAVKAEAAPLTTPRQLATSGTATLGAPAKAPNLWPYWDDSSPPFEVMQADCRARGHALTQEGPDLWRHAVVDPGTYAGTFSQTRLHTYAQVDAWRRGLHESAAFAGTDCGGGRLDA